MPSKLLRIAAKDLEGLDQVNLKSHNGDKSTTRKITLRSDVGKLLEPGVYYYTSINFISDPKEAKLSDKLNTAIQASYRITAAASELFIKLIPRKTVRTMLVQNGTQIVGHLSRALDAFESKEYAESSDGTVVKDFHKSPAFAETLTACWLLAEDDWNSGNRAGPYKIDHDRTFIDLLYKTGVMVPDEYTDNPELWYSINRENFESFPKLDPKFFRGIWPGNDLYKYTEKLKTLLPAELKNFMRAKEAMIVKFSSLTKQQLKSMFSKHIELGYTYDGTHSLLDTMIDYVAKRINDARVLVSTLNLDKAKEEKSVVASPMRTRLSKQLSRACFRTKRKLSDSLSQHTSPAKVRKAGLRGGIKSADSSPLDSRKIESRAKLSDYAGRVLLFSLPASAQDALADDASYGCGK